MPPKKLPPRTIQQQQNQKSQNTLKNQINHASTTAHSKPTIPEHEVKQSSSMSAQLALEAAKKAYDLRQAAYGAGDPNAREEILAKAINKEIEAESFGKAAKYTRSGAFQGLAAGAGLGVQPGVTLGKLTGALVGGVIASVGAVAGGGVGSVYGAISGPFWDLGQMASRGVRNIVGDFPNWEATTGQKDALEKMVMGAQQTKVPDQEELEQMRDDDGGRNDEDYLHFVKDLKGWIPKMPSVPSMPSIPGLGGQSDGKKPIPAGNKTENATALNHSPKAKESTAPRVNSKPQHASPKAISHFSVSQHPQKDGENAARRKPQKLEVRSTRNTSQPEHRAVRRAPPKLETRRKTAKMEE